MPASVMSCDPDRSRCVRDTRPEIAATDASEMVATRLVPPSFRVCRPRSREDSAAKPANRGTAHLGCYEQEYRLHTLFRSTSTNVVQALPSNERGSRGLA